MKFTQQPVIAAILNMLLGAIEKQEILFKVHKMFILAYNSQTHHNRQCFHAQSIDIGEDSDQLSDSCSTWYMLVSILLEACAQMRSKPHSHQLTHRTYMYVTGWNVVLFLQSLTRQSGSCDLQPRAVTNVKQMSLV